MTILITDPYQLLPCNIRAFPAGFATTVDKLEHDYNLPSEDPFNVESDPIMLLYQQYILSDLSRIILIDKSRRIGASWALACKAVLECACAGGMDYLYSSYNMDMTQTFIQDCAYWARAFNIACSEIEEFIFEDEKKDILAYKIRFNSGFEIKALSSRPENFRSKKGAIILDEFAFIQNPDAVLKACMSLLIWGGKLIILSTHNGINSPFNHLVNQVKTGERKDISYHNVTFKDAINQGLYKRICLMSNKEWTLEKEFEWELQIRKEHGVYAAEELDCIPSMDSDLLFDIDAVDRNAIGKWDDRKSNRFYMAAIDPNFGGSDYYTLGIFDVSRLPIRLVYEYAHNNQSTLKSRSDTVEAIKRYKPHLIAIESNSGGMVIAEDLIRLLPGKTIETMATTKPNKIINTDRTATMIENNELIYPKDWAGIDEMKTFSKKLREALVGHDDRVMMTSVGLAFLQQAIETMPRRSRSMVGKDKIVLPKTLY
jgi:hypothetical protein